MRALLLAALAALLLPSAASAQDGRPVKAWYHLRVGDAVETVQAVTVEMTHLRGRTEVRPDGRAMRFDGPVAVSYAGTGSEPMPYGGGRSGSTSASGGDFGGGGSTHTEVEVVIDSDGTSHTKTTTTRTEESGAQTTTTTTTTTTTDGETTTTTTTTS